MELVASVIYVAINNNVEQSLIINGNTVKSISNYQNDVSVLSCKVRKLSIHILYRIPYNIFELFYVLLSQTISTSIDHTASDTPHNPDKTFATDVSSRAQLKANTTVTDKITKWLL